MPTINKDPNKTVITNTSSSFVFLLGYLTYKKRDTLW